MGLSYGNHSSMTSRYYNSVSVKEYAAIHGISERTARRRVASLPGAVKSTGNRWVIPIPSTVYARAKGISAKTARKTATQASDPNAVTSGLKGTLKQRAATNLMSVMMGHTKRPPNYNTIVDRLGHANRRQLARIEQLQTWTPTLTYDPDFEGDDELPTLYYH